jgi:hypothetical protein
MDGGAEDVARAMSHPLCVLSNDLSDSFELFESFSSPERVELAEREANGISVALYWTRLTNVLTVAVADSTCGDYFELVLADDERPLDVFYHPFAYASARGLYLGTSMSQEVVFDGVDAQL